MLRSEFYDILGCRTTDMQALLHLCGTCRVDIHQRTRCIASGNAASASTPRPWHPSHIAWWYLTNQRNVDFFTICQSSSQIKCNEVSFGQWSPCCLQQCIDSRPCRQGVHSWILDCAHDIRLDIPTARGDIPRAVLCGCRCSPIAKVLLGDTWNGRTRCRCDSYVPGQVDHE